MPFRFPVSVQEPLKISDVTNPGTINTVSYLRVCDADGQSSGMAISVPPGTLRKILNIYFFNTYTGTAVKQANVVYRNNNSSGAFSSADFCRISSHSVNAASSWSHSFFIGAGSPTSTAGGTYNSDTMPLPDIWLGEEELVAINVYNGNNGDTIRLVVRYLEVVL